MKNPMNLKNRLGWLALPLYFLILVCLDVAFRLLYQVGVPSWTDWKPLLFTLGWAGVFTAIAGLLRRKGGRIFIITTVSLFALLTIVHGVMYNMFGNFFSFSDFSFAGDGARFFSLNYLNVRKALVLCVALSIPGAILSAWLLPKKGLLRRLPKLIPLIAGVVLLVVMHNSLYHPAYGNVTWDMAMSQTDAVKKKVMYTEFTNVNGSLHLTGLYQYTFRNAAVTLHNLRPDQNKEKVAADVEQWHSTRQEVELSQYAGSLAGKNLIMVMLESVDSVFLTPEYMPNLYALREKSINFQNNYIPMYITGATFGTEFLSQTGLIPPQKGLPTTVYTENSFPYSLANLFRQKGYTANSVHASGAMIYNRGAIHKNLGFEAYHSNLEMGMEDPERDSEMLNGFDLMVSDDPFFSFIITYSGHGPYTDIASNIFGPHIEKAKAAVKTSGVTGTAENMEEFTRAVAQAMETDAFIGGLLEKLEESGHSEDTVLMLYGDHYCKYLTDPAFLMELKGANNRNMLSEVPFLIYAPGMPAMSIENLSSSVDIYPTVCSLFGLETDFSLFVGRDALSPGQGLIYWPDYSWYDGSTYVDGTKGPKNKEQGKITDLVRQNLQASWNMIICDYFSDK